MYIPFLGSFFPIEEAIIIVCIIIVAYLIVMRFEFKQLSLVSAKMDNEESELSKELKELKDELGKLNDIIKSKRSKS